MKARTAILAAICAALIVGCSGQTDDLQKQVAQLQSDKAALESNINERDKYVDEVMRAVNDVYKDLEVARAKEKQLVAKSTDAEGKPQITSADVRQSVLNNIAAIGTTLKENRKRISNLQSQVKKFKGEIAGMNELIENLKKTLLEREQSIATLEARIVGLEATVAEKVKALEEKDHMIDTQIKSMNTAYYIVGTRDELEEKGVITDRGGFPWGLFGSTTVLASGVDPAMFTPIDRSKFETLHIKGRIDEIVPERNEEFFAAAESEDEQTNLTIKSPNRFWQDKYLVVVVD
jgi:predicted  nucleic acid-binding Zn-ribbon protein